jgi:predicted amidophosphoribosyltransferase
MTYAISFAPAHDIHRGHASYTAVPLLARNDNNNPGDERCPACHRPTASLPAASEYCGKGLVHHHWRCRSCGHAWMTVGHVSA